MPAAERRRSLLGWAGRLPLRQLLTLPFALLMLALVLLVGALSWQAGRQTVDTLSAQLLEETVHRIGAALERHVGQADAVLDVAFPNGLPVPTALDDRQTELRQRLWLATSVHRHPHHYVYYGNQQGQFIGLWRFSEQEAELRLRASGQGPRTLYRVSGIQGPLRAPVTEDKVFDPRQRPWFETTLARPQARGWTPVYVDFKTQELVLTRTRRIVNDVGEPEGVAATDLSLRQVQELLAGLTLTENAVALVVEGDGRLLGTSRGTPLHTVDGSQQRRVQARDSGDALVALSVAAVLQQSQGEPDGTGTAPRTFSLEGAEGEDVQVGYARLDPALGLDWRVIVAVPRSDFLGGVQRGLVQAAALAGAATLVALGLGWAVFGVVTRELRRLADAARRVGDGVLDEAPGVQRGDELGDLARALADMQRRLTTDQLTGLSNRGAMLRRIEDHLLQQRRRGDRWPFAVMFIDFSRFKDINARFGHTVGDAVLKELAQRLRTGVRLGDIVARYAGDQFVLLLESVENRADADAARTHLEARLSEPLQSLAGLAPDGFGVTPTLGVALYPDDGLSTEALLRHADADMYARRLPPHADPIDPAPPHAP